jgi:MFS family permease
LLGDPVISLAVVLTALLVSSGAGGLWSQRLGPAALRPALFAAAAALLLAALALWLCAQRLLALPEFWRAAALAAGAALPGAAMGVPFPLGMRFLLDQPAERAFAWAVNGCASVLGSIAAAQLAVGAGLPWLLAAALAGYALAAWGGARDRERPGAGLRFRPPMHRVRP